MDANGKTLGRLATQIADVLRGKRKPEYTPHIDTGDFVVVINAEKIHVSGNKRQDKRYYRHSGYPGGLRSRTFEEMLARRPEEIIRLAVKGMMPRNRLARKQITKLKIYAGPEHPHAAQKPQPMEIEAHDGRRARSPRRLTTPAETPAGEQSTPPDRGGDETPRGRGRADEALRRPGARRAGGDPSSSIRPPATPSRPRMRRRSRLEPRTRRWRLHRRPRSAPGRGAAEARGGVPRRREKIGEQIGCGGRRGDSSEVAEEAAEEIAVRPQARRGDEAELRSRRGGAAHRARSRLCRARTSKWTSSPRAWIRLAASEARTRTRTRSRTRTSTGAERRGERRTRRRSPSRSRRPRSTSPPGARYRATGKRKTAIARVTLRPGSGTYLVNGRALEEHFPRATLQRNIRQPLETVGYEERMDVVARLHGGGISAQAGALRHGVSRALLEADPNLRGELKRRGFLTRDSRAKERKKAGLKKARKRPQFSKR